MIHRLYLNNAIRFATKAWPSAEVRHFVDDTILRTSGTPAKVLLSLGDLGNPIKSINVPFAVLPQSGHLWVGAGVKMGGTKTQTSFDGRVVCGAEAHKTRAWSATEMSAVLDRSWPR